MATALLPPLPSPAVADIMEKSAETIEFLRGNVKVGFTDQRGPAWWAAGLVTKAGTWTEIPDGSHFAGPVPIEAVRAQLDVPLVKGDVHVTYRDENGERQVSSDGDTAPIVNARTGQIFSYPKKGYKIHPYLQTLHGYIEQILFDERVGVGSVGLLKKGGMAFLQAVLPEAFEVAGYGYQPYIMGVTSADLSRATTWATGAKGAVCDNTVTDALAEALTTFKYRHTGGSAPRVQAAREKLGIRLEIVAGQVGEAIEALTQVDVSEQEFAAWLDLTVDVPDPDPKSSTGGRAFTNATARRDELTRLWTQDPKVSPWTGTGFGVYQASNTYRTWTQQVNGASRFERNLTNDALGETKAGDKAALSALATVKDRTRVMALA
jgi:phage/plasmid-like protein (TIGR03299 family)